MVTRLKPSSSTTANWIYNLQTAARMRGYPGKAEIAAQYGQRADAVRRAVHGTVLSPRGQLLCQWLPAYLAMALLTNVPPRDLRPSVWKRLKRDPGPTQGTHLGPALPEVHS